MSSSCAQKYCLPVVVRENASLSTMPCVSSLVKGSSIFTSPRSRITLVQKRAYSRCRMACSMPPMYWSIGIQYCVPSPTMAWSFLGSQ